MPSLPRPINDFEEVSLLTPNVCRNSRLDFEKPTGPDFNSYRRRCNFTPDRILPPDSLVQKFRHQFQRFFGFWQLKVIPEGMGQRLEHDQVRIDASLQQRTMERTRIAQQNIARAGDE